MLIEIEISVAIQEPRLVDPCLREDRRPVDPREAPDKQHRLRDANEDATLLRGHFRTA